MPNKLLQLTQDQCRKIFNQGFAYVEVSPGHYVKVTMEDIRFKKEDIDAFLARELAKKNVEKNKLKPFNNIEIIEQLKEIDS